MNKEKSLSKGQLNSERIYEVIFSPKMSTKKIQDFCPTKQTRIVAKETAYTNQKIAKKSATILVCITMRKKLQKTLDQLIFSKSN